MKDTDVRRRGAVVPAPAAVDGPAQAPLAPMPLPVLPHQQAIQAAFAARPVGPRAADPLANLQAHAYAQGAGIHLAPGQEQHVPHEAWHVVQQ